MNIDLDTRCSGFWMVAQQGVGKTNALLSMIAEDIQKDASIIIIDPKGGPDGLSGPVRKLNLGSRLVVLDPHQPFAINPLDVDKTDVKRAVNQVEYIFSALLDTSVTPMQKSFLRSLLRAVIIGFPDPNLQTIANLIKYGWEEYAQYIPNLPRELQHLFYSQWKSFDATRSQLDWRVGLITEDPVTQQMFSAPHTRYTVAQGMDRGDVFIIDCAIEKLHEDGAAFLGRFFISQIWGAAAARSSRPRHEKKLVVVYIDEADLIIKNDPTIASIIDRCRSQNIALVCSMQRAKQIQDPNVLSALENCAIKMANVDGERSYFSKLLRVPEERMPTVKQKGVFATSIRGEPSISTFPIAKLPVRDMTPIEQAAHTRLMQQLYGVETQTATLVAGVAESVSPSREGKSEDKRSTTEGRPPEADPIKITQEVDDPSLPSKWTPD